MPKDKYEEVAKKALEARQSIPWIPNPGPQTQAYFSKADVLLYGGEPGGGKALEINELIPTPTGFSTMGELTVGDQVFDEAGTPCNVIAKSPIFKGEAYLLKFSDGSQIVADPQHQWITSTRAERMRALKCTDEWRAKRRETRPKRGTGKRPDLALRNAQTAQPKTLSTFSVKTTAEIAQTIRRYDGGLNHAVAVAGALNLPYVELLIDPYVLGAWLGDGTSKGGSIAGIDDEVFRQVEAGGYTVNRYASPYARGVIGLQTKLKQLGVFGNKHIPPSYLRASMDQRLSLLQGLMDTDGYCDKRGQCEIQLTRKELIDGVHELLSSLGIKAQMREGKATLYGRTISNKWRLKFMTDLPAFKLPRKLIRQKRSGFRGTHDVRYIVGCEPIDPVPMQCIQVDSPSHCYLAGRSMIPTHNSSLLLGLALTAHRRSLIMRRQYTDLGHIIEELLRFNGGRDGYNGQPPPSLKRQDGRVIDLGAAARAGDEEHWQGNPHDLLGLDEGTQFSYAQVRFLMGWLRSVEPNQRKRVVIASNPPLSAEGLWVMEMFAPWLDDKHPHPAKPGELRWVVTDERGNDRWVDGPEPVLISGKQVQPTSRTFIPASVSDNPYLATTGYQAQLDAMIEPYRSILLGRFKTVLRDQHNQVIPTAWIRQAQKRWTDKHPDVPMCAMGIDCSGGGTDPLVLAPRYDGWYSPLIVVEGQDIPMDNIGPYSAGVIITHRKDNCLVVVDMGGGYGGSTFDHLKQNGVELYPYKGAEKSTKRTSDKKLGFTNVRSAAYWGFREALDPGQPGGSPIALPDDTVLVADLTAPTFEITPNGIKVEPKDKVTERLGRSTNHADAVVMSWYAGPREKTAAIQWADARMQRNRPRVIMKRKRRLMSHG